MSLPYTPLYEDSKAKHQITLKLGQGYGIAVSCNCQYLRTPIEVRPQWTTVEALAVYRAWHRQRGINLL